MPKPNAHLEKTIERIVHDVLHLETIEPRGRDHLDFPQVSVWEIRRALEQAYEAGRDAGRK